MITNNNYHERRKKSEQTNNQSHKSKEVMRKDGKRRSNICSRVRETNSPGITWFEKKVADGTAISGGGSMARNVMIVRKKQKKTLSADQLGDLKTA